MAVQFAGGTIVNYTWSSNGTRSEMQSNLVTQLGNAGWSTISGGGTSDTLMESATTTQGFKIRARIFDPGSGNCVQITLKNAGGTLTSQIYYMLPTSGKTYRIIANKHQCFFFATTTANRTISRNIVMFGTPYVESFMATYLGSNTDLGWILGSGQSDTDTGNDKGTWRDRLINTQGGVFCYSSSIFNNQLLNNTNNNTAAVRLATWVGYCNGTVAVNYSSTNNNVAGSEFADGTQLQYEPLLCWQITTGVEKIVAQLWDAMVMNLNPAVGEITKTFSSHDFMCITDGPVEGYSSLFVAVD